MLLANTLINLLCVYVMISIITITTILFFMHSVISFSFNVIIIIIIFIFIILPFYASSFFSLSLILWKFPMRLPILTFPLIKWNYYFYYFIKNNWKYFFRFNKLSLSFIHPPDELWVSFRAFAKSASKLNYSRNNIFTLNLLYCHCRSRFFLLPGHSTL